MLHVGGNCEWWKAKDHLKYNGSCRLVFLSVAYCNDPFDKDADTVLSIKYHCHGALLVVIMPHLLGPIEAVGELIVPLPRTSIIDRQNHDQLPQTQSSCKRAYQN